MHVHAIRDDPFRSVLFGKKSKRAATLEYFSAISTFSTQDQGSAELSLEYALWLKLKLLHTV